MKSKTKDTTVDIQSALNENTLRGGHFGHFHNMYVMYIFAKHVAFNFAFHFLCLG